VSHFWGQNVSGLRSKNELLIPAEAGTERIAVLASGGIESAILTARLCEHFEEVQPIYVRFGLQWERAEEIHFRRYLDAIAAGNLLPLKTISQPVDDIYGNHWSLSHGDVPDASTPDESVFLPGRNLLLLSKAFIWCASQGIPTIAMGHLQTNPFPDATDEFFKSLQSAASTALDYSMTIIRPFGSMHKHQVLQLGSGLPLGLTFSCISPIERSGEMFLHCGRCNKCAERQNAFRHLGISDRTEYDTKYASVM
jgi:7-cyano-7-deazaguanine synthase